jgi:insulysin
MRTFLVNLVDLVMHTRTVSTVLTCSRAHMCTYSHAHLFTTVEDTNYYFSVTTEACAENETTEALSGALDRFAQFFIAPTFDRDAVERELRAIDSEHTMSKTSDSWRNFQLMKASCNQEHPFMKFGCGNYATLTEKGLEYLLDELRSFWKTYYQTWNLRLSVVGHGSLDALQKTVEDTFGKLTKSAGKHRRAKSLPGQMFARENAVYGVPAYGPEQLGLIRKVIPHAETRVIKVYFATPPLDDRKLTESMPYRVLSHILGHEAPGSLHALLNEEGYISGLSSGLGIDTADFSLFAITLAVTPKGMEARDKVLDLLFQWIALLKGNEDKLSDYQNELNQISSMDFKFRENGDPTDFASAASDLLFHETTEPAKLLVASSSASDYDPVVSRAFLERITPGNCMITITSSDFDGSSGDWQKEPWYG